MRNSRRHVKYFRSTCARVRARKHQRTEIFAARNVECEISSRGLSDLCSARTAPGTFSIRSIHYSFNICLENSGMRDGRLASLSFTRVYRGFLNVDDARLLRIHSTAFRQVHLSNVSLKEFGDILTMSSLEASAVKLLLFVVRQ